MDVMGGRFGRVGGAGRVTFPASPAQAQQELLQRLHETPHDHGLPSTRWTLSSLSSVVTWLSGCSPGRTHHLLRHLHISRKKPERFARSPDPDFAAKKAAIADAVRLVLSNPLRFRLGYLDQVSYYRHPICKPTYQQQGQPAQRRSWVGGANTLTRSCGVLDLASGALYSEQRSHFPVKKMRTFVQEWAAACRREQPELERLFLVLDNWSVHVSAEFRKAAAEAGVELLYLPTYASWLNPIERVWLWLRQEVLHSHTHATELEVLRGRVRTWLEAQAAPSQEMLRRTCRLTLPNQLRMNT